MIGVTLGRASSWGVTVRHRNGWGASGSLQQGWVSPKTLLSPFPDSLGPLKDDMLLVETRGAHDNRSVCALEPSGCTPLLSRASTVRARGPSSTHLSGSVPSLASKFHRIQFPLLCSRPCAGVWECVCGGGFRPRSCSQWPPSSVQPPPPRTILLSYSLLVF